MERFIEVPASKSSLTKRRKILGVGINDAWYVTSYKGANGKEVRCPYYRKWRNMLGRCYSSPDTVVRVTYKDCLVSDEWLRFSTFKQWMEKQDWEGKQLDKDILVPDNKVYSESTCIFVSGGLNTLLTDNAKNRGDYPKGVCWYKRDSKYVSYCNVQGKLKHLGRFDCVNRAELSYVTFKANHVEEAAYSEEALADSRLTPALLRHAAKFTERAEELTKLINKTT